MLVHRFTDDPKSHQVDTLEVQMKHFKVDFGR